MIYPDIYTGVTPAEAAALESYATGRLVLECGSWQGFSTVVMARVAARVESVDWHHGDRHAGFGETEAIFRNNLRHYGVADKVEVHVGRFEDVLPGLPLRAFDVVFLDGMHDAASVARDIELAVPLIAPDGALLVHDYDVPKSWDFEVKPTLDAWLANHPGWGLTRTVEKLAVVEHRS